ncbi:MAG TPA: serine/threonine-protein kinase [Polyangiaceae bacterium]
MMRRVYDAGALEDGSPDIVMELLVGTDLAALLRSARRLTLATAVDYVLQTCTAVAEAHASGIVHRDLKPANLFLVQRADGSPCIKVLDFGISKSIGAGDLGSVATTAADPSLGDGDTSEKPHGETEAPAPTRAAGSPRYMAPEQVRGARDVDGRADVWALGTILHELVTGAPAFEADDRERLRAAVLERPPRALAEAGVPRTFEAVVLRCLEKDPQDRYPEVASLARALVPFGSNGSMGAASRVARILERAGQVAVEEESAAPESGGPARAARLPRRSFALALAVSVATLAYGVVGIRGGVAAVEARRPLRERARASSKSVIEGADVRAAPRPPPAIAPSVSRPRAPASATPAVAAPPSPARDPFLEVFGGELFRERR